MINSQRLILLARSYFDRSRKFLLFKVNPFIHKQADILVSKITKESGSQYWSALAPSRKWNVLILRSLVGFTGIAIVWSSVTSVDESIQASGKLEPTGSTLPVRAPIGGVVKQILVADGDSVSKGQNLIEMDTTAAVARLKALSEVREQVLAEIQLSKAQLGHDIDSQKLSANQLLRLDSLQNEYDSRINAARNSVNQAMYQISSLESTIQSKSAELSIREETLLQIKPLTLMGALSKLQYSKELAEVEILRGQLKSLKADLSRQKEVHSEQQNRLANTLSLTRVDFSTKLDESFKQLAQLNNQISDAKVTLDYQLLVSPANGLVFDLRPASPGYVVTGETPLLKIVPTDVLVVRAYVTNRDIGFIRVDQPVKVRVDAYPYNEFGELSGVVSSIGSDVLEPDQNFNYYRFPVTISLNSNRFLSKGVELPLISGMSASVNIVLRKRPVIAIFTEQIFPFWGSLEQL